MPLKEKAINSPSVPANNAASPFTIYLELGQLSVQAQRNIVANYNLQAITNKLLVAVKFLSNFESSEFHRIGSYKYLYTIPRE